MNANEVEPGDILFDATGAVSHSSPSTYVVLSRDLDINHERQEWRMACFYGDGSKNGWGGASLSVFWDKDFYHLTKVGCIHHEAVEATT